MNAGLSRVVFVEDDESIRDTFHAGMTHFLRKEGLPHEIEIVSSVDELRAIVEARVQEVAAIATDLCGVGWGDSTATMDTLVQEILAFKEEYRLNVPILIITGSNPGDEHVNLGRGVLAEFQVQIFQKPFRMSELAQKINKMLKEAALVPA